MQQINLYLPEFRPKVEMLSAERSATLLAVLLMLLVGLQVFRASEMSAAESVAAELESQQQKLKEQAAILKKAPKPVKDAALEREIEQLREAIRNREGVAGIIASRSLGNDIGFSHHLVALGQRKVDGVSLEEFSLQAGGAFLRLSGLSQKPELVPLYVSQLQNDDHFKTTKFGYLSLRNQGSGVSFLLSGDGPVDEGTLTLFTEEQLVPGE
jgi:Tfp pilus assembly protein PilN